MNPKLKIKRLPGMENAIAEMKPYTGAGRPRKFKQPVALNLKVEATDRAAWQAQADDESTSLNQWVIAQLNRCSKAE